LLLGLMDMACSTTQQTSTKKLAFVTNNAADFWTIARKGCEQADSELANVDVEFRIPSDGTAAEQRRIVDDLLAKGVSGMAMSPVDPVNQTQMINEVAKQILVLTQDSDAPQSDRACTGTDNVAAGRQAGNDQRGSPGGKIMVFVGKSDARNAQERFQGIKETLQGSKVEILDLRNDDTDRVRAKSNVCTLQHADVAGLVGLWSYNDQPFECRQGCGEGRWSRSSASMKKTRHWRE
jgi:ribose transport system substrate-binding protein